MAQQKLPAIQIWAGLAQRLPPLAFRGVGADATVDVKFGPAQSGAGCSSGCIVQSGAWLEFESGDEGLIFDRQCGQLEVELTEEQASLIQSNGVMQVAFFAEGMLVSDIFSFPIALRRHL